MSRFGQQSVFTELQAAKSIVPWVPTVPDKGKGKGKGKDSGKDIVVAIKAEGSKHACA